MAVGKEYLQPLEHLARNQVRIYPDACDVGIFEWADEVGILLTSDDFRRIP